MISVGEHKQQIIHLFFCTQMMDEVDMKRTVSS